MCHLFVDIDDCDNNYCENGAACLDGVGEYTCLCAVGYEGDLCQTSEYNC